MSTGRRADGKHDAGLLRDAGSGALVALVLSVLPFSPVAGGAVAGFRRSRGYVRGLAAGLLAGVFAAVPLALLFLPALWVVSRLGLVVPPSAPAYDVFLALVGLLFLAYTVGLSALGGLAGVWIGRHTDRTLDPGRWL